MPNLEEHCTHTLERYGVEGREIHQWLDAPSRKYAGGHRQFRHDSETIKLVGKIYGKKLGQQLAENIALDHIMLDHKEEIQRREEEKQRQIFRGFTEEEEMRKKRAMKRSDDMKRREEWERRLKRLFVSIWLIPVPFLAIFNVIWALAWLVDGFMLFITFLFFLAMSK